MLDLMAKETIETIKSTHQFKAEFDLMMHISKMLEEASYNEALRKALKNVSAPSSPSFKPI